MAAGFFIASDVMGMSAALLNDPALTDYTFEAQLPYLNIAITELDQNLQEANIPVTNQVSFVYTLNVGDSSIINLPNDIVEIQELEERAAGSNDSFITLPRKEFPVALPASNSLLFWCWHNRRITFNPNGALSPREVQLKYIGSIFNQVRDQYGSVGPGVGIMYLVYKTAALCALFVGENETRSKHLEDMADEAMERIIGVSNKGKQQIMTRHRPFRAGFKARGY